MAGAAQSTTLLGNYWLEGSAIVDSQTDATQPSFPAENVLDSDPLKPCRFSTTPDGTSKKITIETDTDFANSTGYNPQVLVIGSFVDRGDPAISWLTQRTSWDVGISTSNVEGGPYTGFSVTPTIDLNLSSDFLIDFATESVSNRQQKYYQLTFTNNGTGDVRDLQIGCLMLGAKYSWPNNPLSGMSVSVEGLSVVAGRDRSNVYIHRAWHPRRVLRGRMFIDTDAARDIRIRQMRGFHAGVLPQRHNFVDRAHEITAICPSTEWPAGETDLGWPIIGYYARHSIETLYSGRHVETFEFRELPAEVA